LDVSKHARISWWRHCITDSFKTLKANYMLIRLLRAYRMIKYVSKIFNLKFQAIAEKTEKKLFLGDTFWPQKSID